MNRSNHRCAFVALIAFAAACSQGATGSLPDAGASDALTEADRSSFDATIDGAGVDASMPMDAQPADIVIDGDAATILDAAADSAPFVHAGNLRHVFCDIKKPLAPTTLCPGGDCGEGTITESNYRAILQGFVALGCTGIRVYIDTSQDNTSVDQYPTIYRDVLAYARSGSAGRVLGVYANPLGTGNPYGLSRFQWEIRVERYARMFTPNFIGPFNESTGRSGFDVAAMGYADVLYILDQLRSAGLAPAIVGLDIQHLDTTLMTASNFEGHVDIISSHNAVDDTSATAANWNRLANVLVPTYYANPGHAWASENPRPWSFIDPMSGAEIGVKAVVHSAVDGLVLYRAFPSDVSADGSLTSQGQDMVDGGV